MFLVDKAQTANKAGFMPKKRPWGFVFTNIHYNNTKSLCRTIAHEVAHGEFRLSHPFQDFPGIPERSTQNLMDYADGQQLRKYQWDDIHNLRKVELWGQEEDKGAFVFGETAIENIVRTIRNVRCANSNNAETVNLYFSNFSYSIEIKELVSAFNWAGSDVSNEKIKFYISNDGEINLDYFEDEFDVQNIQYDDNKKQVVLKGKERSLFIEPNDMHSDHKAEIYSFIKTMFDGNVSIKEPTEIEVNEMEIDELRYLSICQLALMSDDKRKETLRSISGQTAIPAKDEKLVLNLLKTTKSPSEIYKLLTDDQVSYKLFKALNTYHKEFIFLFNWICEAGWTEPEKQNAEVIFLGTNDKGVRYQLSKQSWMFDEQEENKVPVWNLEDLGCTNCLSRKFNSSPATPIRIAYFDGNNRIVSTLLVDYLREQENKEEWTDAMISYLSGVGISSVGRVMLTKSTPKIVKFLAFIEFGKTSIDIAFLDEELQKELNNAGHQWFVENWTTISISLDVVTFGSEMIVKFATKGDDLSAIMRANGKTKAADEIDEITSEAKAMLDNAGDLGGSLSKADILISNLTSELRDFANKFKLAGKIETLPDGTTLVLKANNGDELGRILNNKLEITSEQIVKIEKGYRPNPNLYMSEAEINNHLSKFENEGGAFIIRRSDLLNPNYFTIAPRKFVGLKSEMDAIIERFKKANYDIKILIDELDLGDKYFKANDEVYFVSVKPNNGFDFDMPSGNEIGAYDGLWGPGGKTKHGTSEAVLSNSGSFAHNNSWKTFVDFFGAENVKKLK